ncbi:MAG TPA: tetratricopeptide repeat protein [Acetobacteraceae bacterium]|nr:tetratricopeptide repeat protein [Acetobacteraceae bacterium]
MRDARGLEVSGADAGCVAALDRFLADFLAFQDAAANILEFARSEPGCLAAQLYAVGLLCYSQSDTTIATEAAPFLARGQALAAQATERERLLLAAVAAWSRSDFAAGIAALEVLIATAPTDIVAVKFAEFLFFQAPDFPRHLGFMRRAATGCADLPEFGAQLAFAHELNREFGTAIDVAEAAIAAQPDNPWAHHALAHAYLSQGALEQGLAVLPHHAPGWARHGRGIRAHNAWHLALLHLGRREAAPVHALYHGEIFGFDPLSPFEHTDTISLLWRLELAGLPTGADWQPLAEVAAMRAADAVFPFLAAHYVYALGRAGAVPEGEAAIAALQRRHGDAGAWRVGSALLPGVLALAQGDAARAAERLEPAMPSIGSVGGSDAQNDLFRQSFLVALIESGRAAEARTELRRRLEGVQPTPLDEYWLSRAA